MFHLYFINTLNMLHAQCWRWFKAHSKMQIFFFNLKNSLFTSSKSIAHYFLIKWFFLKENTMFKYQTDADVQLFIIYITALYFITCYFENERLLTLLLLFRNRSHVKWNVPRFEKSFLIVLRLSSKARRLQLRDNFMTDFSSTRASYQTWI